MFIKSLEISNFKCVGACQKIEFRPITLLFGPNSAGKSTIIQALHYLREILVRETANIDFKIGGGQIDFGNFENLVHEHDLSRTITLKVTIELPKKTINEYFPLYHCGESLMDKKKFENLYINYLVGRSEAFIGQNLLTEVGLELDICWSKSFHQPYVAKISPEMNGEPLFSIISDSTNEITKLSGFNFEHPLLDSSYPVEYEKEMNDGSQIVSLLSKFGLLTSSKGSSKLLEDFELEIISEKAVPELSKELKIKQQNTQGGPTKKDSPDFRGLTELLTELTLAPIKIVRDCLDSALFIGPIRDIPERKFSPTTNKDKSRISNGLGAWDLLYFDTKGELTESVNEWISNSERLNTPYKIERVKYSDVPISNKSEDSSLEKEQNNENLIIRSEIVLMNQNSGMQVKPSDVGVGISQLLPVVVCTLSKGWNLLTIEQPELHVHPALQVRLGDLFIYATENNPENKKCLIIETHSEQILLRILRRVRETENKKLPKSVIGLIPDRLSVLYVENSDSKVSFRPLRINQHGDFIDRWPNGYFDERGEELF